MAYQSFESIAKAAKSAGEIRFMNVSNGMEVVLPAFVTSFNDNYTVAFGGETTFGRTDPVKHYQSTSRQIQAAFDILGYSKEKALENFRNYGKMIQMLYPVYSNPLASSSNLSRTIKAPPLWRIKYANYISSTTNPNGLLGALSGLSFAPKFESGHFLTNEGEMIPLIYSVSFNFEPIHEQPLGTSVGSDQFIAGNNFPYNQRIIAQTPAPIPGSTNK